MAPVGTCNWGAVLDVGHALRRGHKHFDRVSWCCRVCLETWWHRFVDGRLMVAGCRSAGVAAVSLGLSNLSDPSCPRVASELALSRVVCLSTCGTGLPPAKARLLLELQCSTIATACESHLHGLSWYLSAGE